MKIVIDGFTDKIIQALCRRWSYPVKVLVEKKVDGPDPDPKAKKGATIKVKKMVEVPNPQRKADHIKAQLISYVKNEYRLIVRQDEKDSSEKRADEKVEKEAKLK